MQTTTRAALLFLFGASLVLATSLAAFAADSAVDKSAVDGKALYLAKCAGCHAPDGSKGLKGLSYGYTVNALAGYKAKTYGGAKKEIMQARAASLTTQEMDALGTQVSGF